MIDASSAILLAKGGAIEWCCRMFRLQMTRRVFEEVSVPQRPGAARLQCLAGQRPGIAVMADPVGPLRRPALADLRGLHPGERDTLHHCLIGSARFAIIDDRRGVGVCRRHNILHVNALLCPQLLFFSGRITRHHADLLFSRIDAAGRYSARVRRWAATCSPSDLASFLW